MTKQTLDNLNVTFYSDSNVLNESSFLTASNKGTVWSIEFGNTGAKKVWNNTVDGLLRGVYSKTLASISTSISTWYKLFAGNSYYLWIKIKLANDYKFPNDITTTLKRAYAIPSSSTSTFLVVDIPPQVGGGTWRVINSLESVTFELEDERTLNIKVWPGKDSSVFGAKCSCIYIYHPTLTGIPYQSAQSGFYGTSNLIGASISPAFAESYQDGDNASFTVTPDSGYRFFTPPVVHMGGVEIPLADNGDGSYTASFTVTANFTLDGEAKRAIELKGTLRGVSCDKSFGWYDVSGVSTSNPFRIECTPLPRYVLNASTSPAYATINGEQKNFSFTGEPTHADKCYLNLTSIDYNVSEITIFVEAEYSYEKLGLIGIYAPTETQMLELASKRFYSMTGDGFKDYSEYIISYMKLHLNREAIPSYVQKTVKYGPYSTDITCDLFPDYVVEFDLGRVFISETHGNSIDYEQTTLTAYLPYIGFVELPVQVFMNKPANLHYRVNVASGECLAVFTDDNGVLLRGFAGNMSFNIPVHFNSTLSAIPVNFNSTSRGNSLSDSSSWYLLKELNPYIEARSQIPYEPETPVFGVDDNRINTLSNFSGYCVFSDINMNMGNMTQAEYDEIISLLKTGVII